MSVPIRFSVTAVTILAVLAGCASNDPYQQTSSGSTSDSGMSNTTKYGGIGVLAGAAAGALLNSDNRGKGAAVGAVLGGAAGAGYGYYADKQEEELRQQMAGTGVEVQRQGDAITLVMPGSITFASDSADLASNFYTPLNNLAASFKQYNQNNIEVVGHTDSTGNYQYNMTLSQRRAQSVANYLLAQGVPSARVTTRGAGPSQPVADNGTAAGRSQNRRVEINLTPIPGATGPTSNTGY